MKPSAFIVSAAALVFTGGMRPVSGKSPGRISNLACLLSALAIFPQITFGESPGPDWLPGLQVIEYPRRPGQSDVDKIYLAPEKFGDPIGKTRIASLEATSSLENRCGDRRHPPGSSM